MWKFGILPFGMGNSPAFFLKLPRVLKVSGLLELHSTRLQTIETIEKLCLELWIIITHKVELQINKWSSGLPKFQVIGKEYTTILRETLSYISQSSYSRHTNQFISGQQSLDHRAVHRSADQWFQLWEIQSESPCSGVWSQVRCGKPACLGAEKLGSTTRERPEVSLPRVHQSPQRSIRTEADRKTTPDLWSFHSSQVEKDSQYVLHLLPEASTTF